MACRLQNLERVEKAIRNTCCFIRQYKKLRVRFSFAAFCMLTCSLSHYKRLRFVFMINLLLMHRRVKWASDSYKALFSVVTLSTVETARRSAEVIFCIQKKRYRPFPDNIACISVAFPQCVIRAVDQLQQEPYQLRLLYT